MTFLDTKVALITLGFAVATMLVLASLLFLIPSRENFEKHNNVEVQMIVEDGAYGMQGPEWESLRSKGGLKGVRFVVMKASDPEAARSLVENDARVPDLRVVRGGKSLSRYVDGSWSAESMKAWIQGAIGQ